MSRAYRTALRRLPRTMQYANANGWEYVQNHPHAKLVKQGRTVFIPTSASDHRSDLNARTKLRHLDWELDGR